MMNLTLKVSYRTKWLGTICSFVKETAKALGADEETCSALHLAAEETAMHIIESIPHDESEDAFEVICRPLLDGVEFEFKNIGPPINVDDLPDYDASAPGESSWEGLRLFLANKMVDRLEFVNLGRDGWRTLLFKRFISESTKTEEAHQVNSAPISAETITTRLAGPDDAFAIVQMAYMNYRYSYAKEAFYFREKLEKELASGTIVSFIALGRNDTIIGHFAFIHEKNSPEIIEIGAVMIRPEYRRSRGLLLLTKAFIKYRDSHLEPDQIMMSKLVTAHTLSQKLVKTIGMKPLALCLSTHPRARFLGMDSREGRESTLYAVMRKKESMLFSVNVPPPHREISEKLLEGIGLTVQVNEQDEREDLPPTDWNRSYDPHSHYTTLSTDRYGPDFFPSLCAQVISLSQDRVDTLTVYLPTWIPLPENLNKKMSEAGFLFCGFIFTSAQTLCLVYTRLTNHRLTFDDINVFDPMAETLKQYLLRQHRKLYEH